MIFGHPFASESFEDGYKEGLESGSPWPRLTSDYAELRADEKWDYDKGFRAGREERWRRQDEEGEE